MKLRTTALALAAAAGLAMPTQAAPSLTVARKETRSHRQVASSVAQMVSDQSAQALATRHGLQILNVLWEDTGRYLGSSVGPNISDVTIEVESEDARGQVSKHLMPVIRAPNFTDKTGDVDIDDFFVRVGNEKKGRRMRTISLRQLLANPGRYMSLPRKGRIKGGSLLAKRDDKVLVSAQSTFLPIAQGATTKFHPVIFNYQSSAKNPAVLTILVTRQGTSMTIVDNARDTVSGGSSWGQRLYFNKDGERAPLTAERLADVQASGTTMNGESADSLGADANLLMLIQVPLVVKQPVRMAMPEGAMQPVPMAAGMATKSMAPRRDRGGSDVDVAVLGHGEAEGPYTELDGLTIERDERFPVRVTVQFYQATSNGVVSAADVDAMAKQIAMVYEKAEYVGSLVTPSPHEPVRATAWTGTSARPAGLSWWDFAGLVERYEKYGALGARWVRHAVAGDAAKPIGIAK